MRLKYVNELENPVNNEAAHPAAFLNAQGFNTVQVGYHGSWSNYARGTAGTWMVRMYDVYLIS